MKELNSHRDANILEELCTEYWMKRRDEHPKEKRWWQISSEGSYSGKLVSYTSRIILTQQSWEDFRAPSSAIAYLTVVSEEVMSWDEENTLMALICSDHRKLKLSLAEHMGYVMAQLHWLTRGEMTLPNCEQSWQILTENRTHEWKRWFQPWLLILS